MQLYFIENDSGEVIDVLVMKELKSSRIEHITVEELLTSKDTDAFCAELSHHPNVGEKLSFTQAENGLLVRMIHPYRQIVVHHSVKKRAMFLHNYLALAEHPGCRRLYHRIQKHFNWPTLAVDWYETVRNFPACTRERLKLRKNVEELKLFRTTAPNNPV